MDSRNGLTAETVAEDEYTVGINIFPAFQKGDSRCGVNNSFFVQCKGHIGSHILTVNISPLVIAVYSNAFLSQILSQVFKWFIFINGLVPVIRAGTVDKNDRRKRTVAFREGESARKYPAVMVFNRE